MKQRYNRLNVIRELIKQNKIDNQDTLLNLLKEKGFDVTQATLSRDLKILKVGKISDGWSGYFYSLTDGESVEKDDNNYVEDIRRGLISIEFNGIMGVIKTRSGHASNVAFALDILDFPEILGTIAGDDTVFVLLREGMTKEDLLEDFRDKVPEIEK